MNRWVELTVSAVAFEDNKYAFSLVLTRWSIRELYSRENLGVAFTTLFNMLDAEIEEKRKKLKFDKVWWVLNSILLEDVPKNTDEVDDEGEECNGDG